MELKGYASLLATILCICCLLICAGPQALATEKDKDTVGKTLVPALKAIANQNPDFKIELWTEGKKDEFNFDETVTFKFRANQDCHVTLINIATDGKVHRIFPNKWQKSDKVEKNKEYTIPPKEAEYVFKVAGPVGTDYVKAIASAEPAKGCIETKEETVKPFQEIEDPEVVMKTIKICLDEKDPKKWTETLVTFKIAGPGKDPK